MYKCWCFLENKNGSVKQQLYSYAYVLGQYMSKSGFRKYGCGFID